MSTEKGTSTGSKRSDTEKKNGAPQKEKHKAQRKSKIKKIAARRGGLGLVDLLNQTRVGDVEVTNVAAVAANEIIVVETLRSL